MVLELCVLGVALENKSFDLVVLGLDDVVIGLKGLNLLVFDVWVFGCGLVKKSLGRDVGKIVTEDIEVIEHVSGSNYNSFY